MRPALETRACAMRAAACARQESAAELARLAGLLDAELARLCVARARVDRAIRALERRRDLFRGLAKPRSPAQ